MTILDQRERLLLHYANREYVAKFHEYLREVRGARSQALVAAMADVAQSYISRVEAGDTSHMSHAALCRVLRVYKELEGC